MFFLHLALFIAAWLAATAYTFFSLFNTEVVFTSAHFWFFVIILDLIVFPLIWFWWKRGPKTLSHKTGVLLATLIVAFWWGFVIVYSFLSLHLDDLQLRWLAFAYIWEVMVVGGFIAYLIVRSVRFADSFLSQDLKDSRLTFSQIHARITVLPSRAAVLFASIVTVGYVIGSSQLYYFAALPSAELAKNLITGAVTGILGSFFIFFGLERILEPAARKSGVLAKTPATGFRPPRRRIFQKIYIISSILVLASVVFFWMMAYNQAQTLLENELRLRLAKELESAGKNVRETGRLPSPSEYQSRLGANGELTAAVIPLSYADKIWVERSGEVKIKGFYRLDGEAVLMGSMALRDFSGGLQRFSYTSAIVFVMILVLVASASSFFARSITAPLRELKEAGIRISKGNFVEPVAVYTNDEIEEVGSALDEAQRQLRLSYSGLEAEIDERTKRLNDQLRELERTSKLLIRRDFERQQITEQLREIDEAKTNFVSIAAHQLRTPLSAIKWTFHMLFSGDLGPLEPNQKTIIAQAMESTERLIKLIGDLLNVARIESGQIVYSFESFAVEKMISRLAEEISPMAAEKKLRLEIEKPSVSLPEANGDQEKLSLAVQNIVENAVNYTPSGGMVRIALEMPDKERYRIRVSDTGVGIPKHQLARLFDKFFRADNVMRLQYSGTGLGLYITKRVIEAHGGTIGVESEENKGTTFIVTLPFLR